MAFANLLGGAGRALGAPLYRKYFIGHAIALTARWLYRTAVGWLAWELTHSSVWLGAIALADLLPSVFLTIFAGALADRFGCMRMIRLGQLWSTLILVLLAAMIFSGWINIHALLVMTALFGATEALGMPARMSAVNGMVPKSDLSSAIALGSAAFNASRIVGPAIAGAMIVWTGTGFAVALCAAMFLVFQYVLQTIHIEETTSGRGPRGSLLRDVVSGFAYAWTHSGIRFVMILLTATSFCIRPIIELMPGVSGAVFDAGPTGLAQLLGAIGLGALIASLWIARRGQTQGLTALLVYSAAASGLALMAAMQFSNIWIASFFLMFMGAFMLSGNVASQTLMQANSDPAYRSRVMGLFIIFGYGMPAFGSILIGWAADYIGLARSIGAGAAFMLLAFLWAWPQLRKRARELESGEQRKA